MDPHQVTLSSRAQAIARRHALPELQIKHARARGTTSHETPHFVVVDGELADGQRVRMHCSPARPEQVLGLEVCG